MTGIGAKGRPSRVNGAAETGFRGRWRKVDRHEQTTFILVEGRLPPNQDSLCLPADFSKFPIKSGVVVG
jgi:hypothetical protein